ncbi:hypothetical protein WJU23_20955 [Prosthecobacter sp. SYSU 5D2]|uniref:hypothetical protein n=1 Tax=Prosthecobacter sp. SYSU 5D2 TaxID=3134134 RepID=UPI0031FE46DB
MKFDFTSLETEPLWYFLTHSTAFVAGLGCLFFLLGLWFGGLTWGRYKRQNRHLQEETDSLREEVAGLKRKMAEQALKPATPPVQELLPPKLSAQVPPSPPALFPERKIEAPAPLTQPVAETPPVPLIPDLPELQMSDRPVIKEAALSRIQMKLDSLAKSRPPAAAPATPPPEDEDAVEPFSFLMDEEPEEEKQPALLNEDKNDEEGQNGLDLLGIGSALDFIIDPDAGAIPAPASAPPSVIPENDPALGLVYKEPPPDVDDLTRVNGISPALQNRLHEVGVYRFQQISAWNQVQIREFSRRLAFKDRIERERWVEQARRLAEGELV